MTLPAPQSLHEIQWRSANPDSYRGRLRSFTYVTDIFFLQKVDYNYNIRGWLKSINNVRNLPQVETQPIYSLLK